MILLMFLQSDVAHALGVCHRVHLLNRVVSLVEVIEPHSSHTLQVTDSTLGGVPTRIFQPVAVGQRLRRGIVYFHGGGWALGSGRECKPTSDCLNASLLLLPKMTLTLICCRDAIVRPPLSEDGKRSGRRGHVCGVSSTPILLHVAITWEVKNNFGYRLGFGCSILNGH